MIKSTFVFNPVLVGMTYDNTTLVLEFKNQYRSYAPVEKEIAYGLFYSKTPATYFSENIKNKLKVIDIKLKVPKKWKI